MNREKWIDSCRFFAMFWILIGHFLAAFDPAALALWEPGPWYWLLGGFRGKLAFTLYFVLIGYFASAPKKATLRAFLRYCRRRYFLLAFFSFFAVLFFLVAGRVVAHVFRTPDADVFRILSDGPRYNLIFFLHEAFLLQWHYIDSFWCLPHILMASVAGRLLGYLPETLSPSRRFMIGAALCALLPAIDGELFIWTSVGCMGYCLRMGLLIAEEHPRMTKPAVLISLFIACVAVLKIPIEEGVLLFVIEGVVDSLLMFIQYHVEPVKRAFSKPPFPRLGMLSMGIFVIHTPVYSLLRSSVYPLLHGIVPERLLLGLCFVLGVGLTLVGAWVLHGLYDRVRRIRLRTPTAVS